MDEVLVKYLAGLIDSDGSISFNFGKANQEKTAYFIKLHISLSASHAIDFHGFIDSLPDLTGFGAVDVAVGHNKSKQPISRWTVRKKAHLEMLVPRLVKHMMVKGRHLQRLFDKWKEKRGGSISAEECEALKEFSKASRLDSGPLKPKNFPSWGWLAGYLDGNGSIRVGRKKDGFYKGQQKYSHQASVNATCHINDIAVLEFIQKAHGGYVKPNKACPNCASWERSLGKRDRSFALDFLSRLVRHSRLKKHKIEQLIAFHHATSNDLSERTPAGGAIV